MRSFCLRSFCSPFGIVHAEHIMHNDVDKGINETCMCGNSSGNVMLLVDCI